MTAAPELGRYRLLRPLGRGGMGEVYLAKTQGVAGFEKLVAVKILDPQAGRSTPVTRLLREAFIGAHLDHENIVQILDLGDSDGRYYLVMEYVRGFSLEHLLRWARESGVVPPVSTALHVVRAMASALEYAHAARGPEGEPLGLMHRDVSPSNVLLAADGRVKLSDFGVAALAADEVGPGIVGKPPYLPPEAFERGRAAPSWDVYALGLVLYECLAGQHAFEDLDEKLLVEAIRRGPAPLASRRPDCPPSIVEVVERAIAREPAARLATATDLRVALERAVRRTVDEAEEHRAFMTHLYAREDFVRLHGELPRLGNLAAAPLQPLEHASKELAYGATVATPPAAPLRFGLTPAHGTGIAREKAERLAARLKTTLGQPVRCLVVADYRGVAECLISGEVDFAWVPPLPFVQAAERGAGIIVAARRAGVAAYRWAITVRKDAPFERLGDLRGQSIAWVDRESASGYVFAAAEIARTLGPLESVFSEQHFQGSHQAACEAVANGWVAACATYATCDTEGRILRGGWLELLGEKGKLLRPLVIGCPIPADNIAHRPKLAPEVIERLQAAFVALSEDEEGRALLQAVFTADSFVKADRALYDELRESTALVRTG